MSRAPKPLGALSKNLTLAERRERNEQERKLMSGSDDIVPSYYLNDEQVQRFNSLVDELLPSGILSNQDSENLSAYIFALDNLERVNDMINRNQDNLFDKQLMASREKLVKEIARYTTEFCLSPTARAKMVQAKVSAKEKKEDPLLKALGGGKK